ncbi:MAG: hypothetical protein AAF761_11065 [Pseudomonadota bacterium]
MDPKTLQLIGLFLDAVGIGLLFFYQIDFNREVGTGPRTIGLKLGEEERSNAEERKYTRYARLTRLAIFLIFVGLDFRSLEC